MNELSNPPLPWYRQFWPWFLIAIPALSIVGGIAMIWIAGKGDLVLVDEDYYQSGLDINQKLALDNFAREARLQANVLVPSDNTQVSVYLRGNIKAPAALRLQLTSAKDASRDKSFKLTRVNDMLYQGASAHLVPGHYTVQLLDNDGTWRLSGTSRFPADAPLQLSGTPLD